MTELTTELQDLLETAITEEKYAAADFLSKTLRSRSDHPAFKAEPDVPVMLECDPDWLDWGPGSQPMFGNETPAQMRARQSQWPRWRKTIGRFIGVYIGP